MYFGIKGEKQADKIVAVSTLKKFHIKKGKQIPLPQKKLLSFDENKIKILHDFS